MPSDGTMQIQLTGKELPAYPTMRVDSSLARTLVQESLLQMRIIYVSILFNRRGDQNTDRIL